MTAARTAAVIGGGIGGLTAALALAQRGLTVDLYEQAPELTEVGAGLQVSPNGARVLQALGLGGALEAAGLAAEAVEPMDGLTGARIARFDLSGQQPAYRFLHRAELIGLLAEAAQAAGVQVHLNAQVTDYDGPAELVVAADGIKSTHRAQVLGPQDPFFTGQVAWRAVVPGDVPPVARIWMLPGGHVVSYPLSGGRVNLVAVREEANWAAEGWHHASSQADLLAVFANVCKDLRDLLEVVGPVAKWGLFRHPVAERWSRDRLCLLGDAAHPTLPFLAQGANLALEDAYVLARCVAEQDRLRTALKTYEQARKARVARAIGAANANARNYHLRGIRRQVAHAGLRGIGALAPGAFLRRLDWLYGFDVTA